MSKALSEGGRARHMHSINRHGVVAWKGCAIAVWLSGCFFIKVELAGEEDKDATRRRTVSPRSTFLTGNDTSLAFCKALEHPFGTAQAGNLFRRDETGCRRLLLVDLLSNGEGSDGRAPTSSSR